MGTSVNRVVCNVCGISFSMSLEWEGKEAALKIIKETKCPECKSDDWYFTDDMGQ